MGCIELLPPLLEQAPPAQNLIRNHHQRLLVQPRHARRRTKPRVHPARKRRHLLLLHAQVVERHRVGPAGGRCREPQRSPACAEAQTLLCISVLLLAELFMIIVMKSKRLKVYARSELISTKLPIVKDLIEID